MSQNECMILFHCGLKNQVITICKPDNCKNNKICIGKDRAQRKYFSTKAHWIDIQNWHRVVYDIAKDEQIAT